MTKDSEVQHASSGPYRITRSLPLEYCERARLWR